MTQMGRERAVEELERKETVVHRKARELTEQHLQRPDLVNAKFTEWLDEHPEMLGATVAVGVNYILNHELMLARGRRAIQIRDQG